LNRSVKRATIVAAFALGMGLAGAAPAVAAPGDNWGQEVKACNQTDCYPGGTNRGTYVRGQAHDGESPGYAWEIHNLADPGKSDPKKFQ
jgi:hypothetical protein